MIDPVEYRALAEVHLYEAERQPDWPPYAKADDEALRDLRYRINGALRRGIESCRKVAVERVAAALATLDGEHWPSCDRRVSNAWKPEQRAALTAQRRQRYRHEAACVIAALYGYMEVEHPQETEAQRAIIVAEAAAQRLADEAAVKAWKGAPYRLPSTVTQLPKEG